MSKALKLVSLAQAEKLKDVGFNYPTTEAYFNGSEGWVELPDTKPVNHNGIASEYYLSRPSLALAAMWIREEKWMHIAVETYHYDINHFHWESRLYKLEDGNDIWISDRMNSYDDALSEGISRAIIQLIN